MADSKASLRYPPPEMPPSNSQWPPISPPVGQIKVSARTRSAQQRTTELQSLLQGRLQTFALLGLTATSVFLVKDLLAGPRSSAALLAVDIASQSILITANAVAAGLLWTRR